MGGGNAVQSDSPPCPEKIFLGQSRPGKIHCSGKELRSNCYRRYVPDESFALEPRENGASPRLVPTRNSFRPGKCRDVWTHLWPNGLSDRSCGRFARRESEQQRRCGHGVDEFTNLPVL